MNRLKSFFNILLLSCLSIGLTGCYDDLLGYRDGVNGEGEVILELEAAFSPFAEGNLTRASNVAPARGFNTISDIAILVFETDGKLLPDPDYNMTEIKEPATEDYDRYDSDASNGTSAETKTKSVSEIPLKLPFGTYYVVGVANFGTYSSTTGSISIEKTSLENIKEKLGEEFTLDDLRALKTEWDFDDYANNREMMGFFTTGDSKPHSGSQFETLTVDRPGLKPRAWLRRCASKITVDFDGSQLRDNISIYIKDVKIYDIAKECTLGFGTDNSDAALYDEGAMIFDFNNHPESDEDIILHDVSDKNGESYKDKQRIVFGEGDYSSWPMISKQRPYIMQTNDVNDNNRKDLHTQDSECLYFYENMQGTIRGYDRTPVPDLVNGGVSEGYNKKDGVPYGTYIEVTAHYVSDVVGNADSYDIKYRFMLGKNVTDNFDAERNYHYKLTLKFLGNANEYHWHIDYGQEEGFKVPNPWYVSYLYNHDAYLPFEFQLDEGNELVSMVAEIITNPWYPTNGEETKEETLKDPENIDLTPLQPAGDPLYPYTGDNIVKSGKPYNGFLSLRAPKDESVLTDGDVGHTWGKDGIGYNDLGAKVNEDYYDNNNLGTRIIYDENNGFANSESTDEFTKARENITGKFDKSKNNYSISIPLFTREKALVKQTGYTGNNPFVGYQRVAQVKLTAIVRDKDGNEKPMEQVVNVVQVRRVVNPKGVYRSSGNYAPFHVTLKFQSNEESTATFRDIISRGPWMAEILGDDNFITLDGKQRVTGSSGEPIDFTIRFNRIGGDGNKNAIVRVKYHNYTCTHLIFVRRGLDDQALSSTGKNYNGEQEKPTVWSTFNLIAENKIAEDPRDEGSLFKFGNSSRSIDTYNNAYRINGREAYYDLTDTDFQPDGPFFTCNENGEDFSVNDNGIAFTNNGQRKWKWTDIPQKPGGFTDGKAANTATIRDFEQLYLTKYIEFGYGVLYADGATTTQETLEYVNGWHRHDKSGDRDKKGMRGVFAYYWNPSDLNDPCNGRSIFFPIGRSGYGHRKEGEAHTYTAPNVPSAGFGRMEEHQGEGILRYSCQRYKLANDFGGAYSTFQYVAPLFESLYRRPGAIYWAKEKVAAGAFLTWNGDVEDGNYYPAYGLDLNYFTLDVNAITSYNVGDGNDACFVRTVRPSASD